MTWARLHLSMEALQMEAVSQHQQVSSQPHFLRFAFARFLCEKTSSLHACAMTNVSTESNRRGINGAALVFKEQGLSYVLLSHVSIV
jgi:hypothetical protein